MAVTVKPGLSALGRHSEYLRESWARSPMILLTHASGQMFLTMLLNLKILSDEILYRSLPMFELDTAVP